MLAWAPAPLKDAVTADLISEKVEANIKTDVGDSEIRSIWIPSNSFYLTIVKVLL